MRRRSRTRRILKWLGTLLCVFMLGLWSLSGWYQFCVFYSRAVGEWLDVRAGLVFVEWVDRTVAQQRPHVASSVLEELPANDPGVYLTKQKTLKYHWVLPGYRGAGFDPRQRAWLTQSRAWIPLWLPFGLIAIPTAFLWWRDRPIPPGHCQRCGYDLTGNISGCCPECGTPAKPEDKMA